MQTHSSWLVQLVSACCRSLLKTSEHSDLKCVVEIHESFFQGKRKYNRGRFINVDLVTAENIEDKDKNDINKINEYKNLNQNVSNRNYGLRVQGP